MSEWASESDIEYGRKLAEEGLDLLRIINKFPRNELLLLLDGKAQCTGIVGNRVRRFCEHILPRILDIRDLGSARSWPAVRFGVGAAEQRCDRILRTVERTNDSAPIYPFGKTHAQFEHTEGEGTRRVPYRSAHEVAICWVYMEFVEHIHDWFHRDVIEDGVADEILRGEGDAEWFVDLLQCCPIPGERIDELRVRVTQEWRNALEFVSGIHAAVPSGSAGTPPDVRSAAIEARALPPEDLNSLAKLIANRLNDSDKETLQAVAELTYGNCLPRTNEVIATHISPDLNGNQMKPRTGALFRHGLLDKGANSPGFVVSEFGVLVVSHVFPEGLT